jgi:hypothetical protein
MKYVKTFEDFLNETISFNTDTTGREDWDDDLKKHSSEFIQIIVNMSPIDFLKRVQHHRFEVNKTKVANYVKEFRGNAKDIPAPTMWFADKFQYDKGLAPSFHDGSHRMLALQEIGVKEVPVKIIY